MDTSLKFLRTFVSLPSPKSESKRFAFIIYLPENINHQGGKDDVGVKFHVEKCEKARGRKQTERRKHPECVFIANPSMFHPLHSQMCIYAVENE